VRDLKGKVVVVTGAGSGLGRCLALEFAGHGAKVHGVDIDGARADALQREARASGLLSVSGHQVDCSDVVAVEALAAGIMDEDGRVDVLVNNAGVCVGGLVQDIPLKDWQWITDVNWWAAVNGIRAFLPGMIQRGEGHVVNVASMAGVLGLPGVAPYCATKAAVVALSESMAIEVASAGVGVTVVCPGSIRTRVIEDARLAMPAAWKNRLAGLMDRWSRSPERVAARVVRAVRSGRSVLRLPGELWPLWILRRLSTRVYIGVLSRAFGPSMRTWRAKSPESAGKDAK